MIKYSSIDIIKRAEQLADLENSDFISNYEKLALLNENWTMLYQKIINSGDKTFIKKLSVCNGTKLPPDFYQMSDIYTKKGHMPVLRCNAEQMDGYDLIEGRFVLSKTYDGVEVVVEYYPAPKTLYLKSKTRDSDYDLDTVACNSSLYFTNDGNLIKDLYDPDVRAEAQFTSDNVAMFDNAAVSYDYVQRQDYKTIKCGGGYYYLAYSNYKTIFDYTIGTAIYGGCNEGKILGDDISIHFPDTPILEVSDYPTVQDVVDAGYCPKYICNNTEGQVAMSKVKALALSEKVNVGSMTLAANTSSHQMYGTSLVSEYIASKVSFTYKGQQYEINGVRGDASYSDFEYKENGSVVFSFTDVVSRYGIHTYEYSNKTGSDIQVENIVFYHVKPTEVWLPVLFAPGYPFTWTVSTDSFECAESNTISWITQEPSENVAIPDTTESGSSGWSSKELAMQVFLYDSGSLATAFEESTTVVPFIIDNVLYVMDKDTYEIYDFYGNKYDTLSTRFESAPGWIYANKGYDTMYAVYDNQMAYYNRLEKVASYSCDEFRGKAVLNGKTLYGVTTGSKLIKCKDKIDIIETTYVPVTVINEKTVLTHKPMTSRYYVEGMIEDTVLDFSNNIYYIMLSYLLAISFKSKQGADVTLLSNQLAVAEQQFYDSINKDINGQYTIKNVYKSRRFL